MNLSEEINNIVDEIENHIEGEIPVKTKARKKRDTEDYPLSLGQLSGSDVVRIMDFLHKKYLSWLREAESTKYVDVVRSIREETVTEINRFYSDIFKQYEERFKRHEEILEKLIKSVDELSNKISVVKEGEKEKIVVKQSILDDPRVRALGYVIYESLSEKNQTLQKFKPFVQHILLSDLMSQDQGEENVQVENDNQGSGDHQSN